MKPLKESILDNEDSIINNMSKDIITTQLFNINNKHFNKAHSKENCDIYGLEVKIGDYVIYHDEDYYNTIIGKVVAIDPQHPWSCKIVPTEKELNEFNKYLEKDKYDEGEYNGYFLDSIKIPQEIVTKLLRTIK